MARTCLPSCNGNNKSDGGFQPPAPPVAFAVLLGSLFGPAIAVAAPPGVPSTPGAPLMPVVPIIVTVSACAGCGCAARNTLALSNASAPKSFVFTAIPPNGLAAFQLSRVLHRGLPAGSRKAKSEYDTASCRQSSDS